MKETKALSEPLRAGSPRRCFWEGQGREVAQGQVWRGSVAPCPLATAAHHLSLDSVQVQGLGHLCSLASAALASTLEETPLQQDLWTDPTLE